MGPARLVCEKKSERASLWRRKFNMARAPRSVVAGGSGAPIGEASGPSVSCVLGEVSRQLPTGLRSLNSVRQRVGGSRSMS